MDIVKKHLFAIICGVVALVAVIAYFVPLGGWYETFNGDLKKRADVATAINSLINQKRLLPIVNPEQNQPEPLKTFPNVMRITMGSEQTGRVATAANEVLLRAVSINRADHELLDSRALPRPDPSSKTEFKQAYNAALRSNPIMPTPAGTAATGTAPTTAPASGPAAAPVDKRNIPDGILEAAAPPTDAEIQAAWQREWEANYEIKLMYVDAPAPAGGAAGAAQKPAAFNLKQIQAEMLEKNKNFAAEFRRKRANDFKAYIEPSALSVAARMGVGDTPSAEDIWFAQMALWVQQDAARAIAATNANSKGGILGSPVKHILRIDVPQGLEMYAMATDPTAPGSPAAAGPAMPMEDPAAVISPHFNRSPTGRVSNALYDVVNFEVDVIVDAAHVRYFLQQMEHGRLITVLETDMQTVDLKLAKERGYDYGDRPVVRVAIKCEALYMRDWTSRPAPNSSNPPPMPPEVMRMLGIAPPSGPAPAATADAGR